MTAAIDAAIDAETSLGADNFKDVCDCILLELRDNKIISPEEYKQEKFFFEHAYNLLKYEWAYGLV